MQNNKFSVTQIFRDYRLFEIFLLGIISGMPMAVLLTTLVTWLTESNIPLTIITTFTVARLPYSLKIFWAPLVDVFSIPFLKRFGHRKSWLILCSLFLAGILFILSTISPDHSLKMLYFLSIGIGVLSATYDVSFDALRIDKLEKEMQALGGATAIFGYRIGMLITGAGALGFAQNSESWSLTFMVLAALFLLAALFIITVREPEIDRSNKLKLPDNFLRLLIIDPFADFLARDKAVIILLAIISYKLGDAMLGAVALPFYLEIGFTKAQIALIVKVFGVIATLAGAYIGGYILAREGNFKGLMICGIGQSITNLVFIWLLYSGPDVKILGAVITIENLAAGMGDAALVGFLSSICNKQYSATQYALFSSASGLCRNTIAVYAGKLVQILGWSNFFVLTVILAFPGLLLLYYIRKKL